MAPTGQGRIEAQAAGGGAFRHVPFSGVARGDGNEAIGTESVRHPQEEGVRYVMTHHGVRVALARGMREGPWHVRLKKGEGGLPAPSVLLCEQITTVPKEWLDATALGGSLSAARIGEVERAVLRAIGVP